MNAEWNRRASLEKSAIPETLVLPQRASARWYIRTYVGLADRKVHPDTNAPVDD
jgi:hypothetical protein